MLIMIFEDNHNHVGRIPSLDENIEDKEVGGVKQILDLASSHTHAHAHATHFCMCSSVKVIQLEMTQRCVRAWGRGEEGRAVGVWGDSSG